MTNKTNIIIFLLFLLQYAYTQQNETNLPNSQGSQTESDKKIVKDTLPQIKFSYKLTDFTQRDSVAFDTLIDKKHLLLPAFDKGYNYTYLGRLGMAMQSNYYFDRKRSPQNFMFAKNFSTYMHTTENTNYFINTKPYTLFEYKTGGTDNDLEQVVKLVHSQTRARKVNFGFDIDAALVNSPTNLYVNENIGATVFGGYLGERYKNNVSVVYNTLSFFETGGAKKDTNIYFKDLNVFSYEKQLNDKDKGRSKIRNLSVMVSQGYYFGQTNSQRLDTTPKTKIFNNSINYILKFDYYKRNYSDFEPHNKQLGTFYKNRYFITDTTRDSCIQQNITQEIQLNLSKVFPYFPFFRLSVFNENLNYRFNDMGKQAFIPLITGDTIKQINNLGYYVNNGIRAALWNSNRNILYFGVKGEYYAPGFNSNRANDITLQGYTGIRFGQSDSALRLEGNAIIQNFSPEVYYQNFLSNHMAWKNNFIKQNHTGLSGTLYFPKLSFYAKLNIVREDNYLYFDSMAMPKQATKFAVNIVGLEIEKTFKLWRFSSLQNIRWQQCDHQEVLPLPEFSYYTSNAYTQNIRFFTGGNLLLQFGVDFSWFSSFYAQAYMPATAMFYLQPKSQKSYIGNYPQTDVFLKIKVKRLSIITRYDHINAGYTGDRRFNALHYPMPGGMFYYGISWLFYD